MSYERIIASIDAELSRLQEARSLLSDIPDALVIVKRGRPKAAKKVAAASKAPRKSQARPRQNAP